MSESLTEEEKQARTERFLEPIRAQQHQLMSERETEQAAMSAERETQGPGWAVAYWSQWVKENPEQTPWHIRTLFQNWQAITAPGKPGAWKNTQQMRLAEQGMDTSEEDFPLVDWDLVMVDEFTPHELAEELLEKQVARAFEMWAEDAAYRRLIGLRPRPAGVWGFDDGQIMISQIEFPGPDQELAMTVTLHELLEPPQGPFLTLLTWATTLEILEDFVAIHVLVNRMISARHPERRPEPMPLWASQWMAQHRRELTEDPQADLEAYKAKWREGR